MTVCEIAFEVGITNMSRLSDPTNDPQFLLEIDLELSDGPDVLHLLQTVRVNDH